MHNGENPRWIEGQQQKQKANTPLEYNDTKILYFII